MFELLKYSKASVNSLIPLLTHLQENLQAMQIYEFQEEELQDITKGLKRFLELFTKIKTQVGTDDFFRTDVDVNRSFADGKLSARFIGAYENLLAWAEPSGGGAHLLAGSIVLKPNDRISLTIDLESYTKNQTPLIGMKPNLQVAGFNSATAANYPVLTDRARAQAYIDAGNLNLGFLGFEMRFEHRFEPGLPLYMGIVRDGCELHLSEHHGDACPGASVRIEAGDVDALQAELIAKAYGHARPTAHDQPWGTRDMTVTDPFGNRLTFTSAISV